MAQAVALDSEAVRALEPVLRAWARRAVNDPELARDLVQDTLLAAVEQGGFQGRSSLRTWVISILSHKIIDHYRRKKPQVLELPHDDEPGSDLLEHPDARELEQVLDRRRAVEQLQLALPKLPELERMAFMLVDVEAMEREEAQAALSVSAVHLRVLLHRARNRLRRLLEQPALPRRP